MGKNKEREPISKYVTYKSIPYIRKGLVFQKRRKKGTEEPVVGTETGLLYGTITPVDELEEQEIDTLPFIKLYLEAIDLLRDLSTPGIKVLCYILRNLKEGSAEIILPPAEVMQYNKWNTTVPYYRGIRDLLEINFISRQIGSNSRYYINVNLIFNGDRRKLYK